MAAYYNEFDPQAAAWLRELISRGLIADGQVDERSIVDVKPDDLREFKQCHFFAGIGVWSHSLRKAGWSDDRAVWTGSCPCQPFSAAGKGNGFDDERHLWPHFHWLISQCRPDVVFGEQVASKDGLGWFDLVQADMEGTGYTCGAVDTCAAGFGAPHIRQRLYWVANTNGGNACAEWQQHGGEQRFLSQDGSSVREEREGSRLELSGLADAGLQQPEQFARQGARPHEAKSGRPSSELAGCSYPDRMDDPLGHGRRESGNRHNDRHDGKQLAPNGSNDVRMADARCEQREWGKGTAKGGKHDGKNAGRLESHYGPLGLNETRHGPQSARPTNGFWSNADWLFCRDGKWRPVEPGTFPLVNGASARVGRLRGYGNAIVAEQATAFVEAFIAIDREQGGANDHPSP